MPKNLYCDIAQFRQRFTQATALDAVDETQLLGVMERAARAIDAHTHRHFFAETATRYFDGDGTDELWVPDLLAITTIKLDEDGDRTYGLTLNAATDYIAERPGYRDIDALPRTRIRLDDVNGQRSSFTDRPRLVEIAGRWGYTEAVERVAPTITLADATSEAATLSAAGDIATGQTLRVAASGEQVFVRSGGGTVNLTVTRGVNGTTAAGAAASAIDRFIYTDAVREAALTLTVRRWQRGKAGFASVTANQNIGAFEVARGMMVDPDVQGDLAELVRTDGMI